MQQQEKSAIENKKLWMTRGKRAQKKVFFYICFALRLEKVAQFYPTSLLFNAASTDEKCNSIPNHIEMQFVIRIINIEEIWNI